MTRAINFVVAGNYWSAVIFLMLVCEKALLSELAASTSVDGGRAGWRDASQKWAPPQGKKGKE